MLWLRAERYDLLAVNERIARGGRRSSISVSSTQRLETAARVMPWRLAISVMVAPS